MGRTSKPASLCSASDTVSTLYPQILAGAVTAAAQVPVRLLRRALDQLATACSQPPPGS